METHNYILECKFIDTAFGCHNDVWRLQYFCSACEKELQSKVTAKEHRESNRHEKKCAKADKKAAKEKAAEKAAAQKAAAQKALPFYCVPIPEFVSSERQVSHKNFSKAGLLSSTQCRKAPPDTLHHGDQCSTLFVVVGTKPRSQLYPQPPPSGCQVRPSTPLWWGPPPHTHL